MMNATVRGGGVAGVPIVRFCHIILSGLVTFLKLVFLNKILLLSLSCTWQVVTTTGEVRYWYLSLSLVTLALETVFTLILKESREWKWFCPSIFIYLSSVVPAIWLLELDKYYKGSWAYLNATREFSTLNLTSLAALNVILRSSSVHVVNTWPLVEVSEEVWATLLEQFLMLALILGRWLLPLGTLTREQLSQLLLVHIGTAADIIEFFDSFKDDRVANKEVLFFLVLAIWSWSLLQFTIIIPASQVKLKPSYIRRQGEDKERRDAMKGEKKCCLLRNNGDDESSDGEIFCCGCCTSYVRTKKSASAFSSSSPPSSSSSSSCCSSCFGCCCDLVVCGVFLEIVLQDAPFLAFRLLLILHYSIVSYMNVFFTAKNTLVIALQFYRLLVVQVSASFPGGR
ncbi:transmembrane protein 26-like [Macrobrachium rosenbergii]|uniref:transmembrane protein 26-like n=1 Tax=Macrobrachium rosenbergii TaxID=79674 RepID=UPI0034D51EE4